MLSPLWWLPLAVAAAAIVPLWRGARRLADEAAGLRTAIADLRLVRPVVAAVKVEIAALTATAGAPTAGTAAAGSGAEIAALTAGAAGPAGTAAGTDHDFGHR
jgi:hypothetical protein